VRRSAFSSRVAGFAVSDIITRGEVPQQIRQDMLLWVGCIAGALRDDEYGNKLNAVGDSSRSQSTRPGSKKSRTRGNSCQEKVWMWTRSHPSPLSAL
jgi:hypothetical protein